MFSDKVARVEPAFRVFAITGAHKWSNEFTDLKMKVREIKSAPGTDSGDALAAVYFFTSSHQNSVAMSVV